MGNYNGTVRCGVCYQRGHNKRTCPRQTQRLADRLETYQRYAQAAAESGEANRWAGQIESLAGQIAKRTGVNPITGTKVAARGPTRRCSYCKYKHGSYSDEGLGHTRRTCATMKEDMAAAIELNAAYRAGILESLRDAGAGVGTLMSVQMSGYFPTPDGEEKWGRRACAVMVRRLNWDAVNYTSQHDDFIQGQRMDKMGSADGYASMMGPYRYTEDETGHREAVRFSEAGWGPRGSLVGSWDPGTPSEPERVQTYVLSRVPSETINPPPGWLTGESAALVAHFKTLKR